MEKTAAKPRSRPVTVRDKAIGLIIAALLLALCAGTWLKPDLVSTLNASRSSDPGGQDLARLLDILWSRPAGGVAGALGLFIAWGALTRKVGQRLDLDK